MASPTGIDGSRYATDATSGTAWWFVDTLAVLKNPPGSPRTPVIMEMTVPPGSAPPEHVHDALDDAFLMLDGELAVRCGDESFVAGPGTYVNLPHGTPHTFRVTSSAPARFLLVHNDDSYLRWVEAHGIPTVEHTLPPAEAILIDVEALVQQSADHGAPVVGAPMDEDEARAIVAGA